MKHFVVTQDSQKQLTNPMTAETTFYYNCNELSFPLILIVSKLAGGTTHIYVGYHQ